MRAALRPFVGHRTFLSTFLKFLRIGRAQSVARQLRLQDLRTDPRPLGLRQGHTP